MSEMPAPAQPPKCADCGGPLDPRDVELFTVCDACWEKIYTRHPVAALTEPDEG